MWSLNRKWYYRLIEDLLSEVVSEKLLIGYTPDPKTHLFGAFNNHIQFGRWYYELSESQRHFYEIISAQKPQKPYFDIDIEDLTIDPQLILEEVISAILRAFQSFNISLSLNKHVLVFSSHGPGKFSYHVIIDGYCFMDLKEAKIWVKRICELIPTNAKIYLDQKVYTQHRQFRIVDSCKSDSGRYKRYQSMWSLKDQKIVQDVPEDLYIRQLHILGKSLISVTDDCLIIPRIYQKSTPSKFLTVQIESELVDKALQLSHPEVPIDSPGFPYSITKVLDNGFIVLKRLHVTYCKQCMRSHQNENPYILVIAGKTSTKAYFNCRRSHDSTLLGILKEGKPVPIHTKDRSVARMNKHDFDTVSI